MNEKNLEYLENNLKYLGFGDKLNESLKESMLKGNTGFKLTTDTSIPSSTQKDNVKIKDNIAYELNFSKGKDGDVFFLNNYTAELKKAGELDAVAQTFYVNKGKGVTAKEAYNLLSGRAVNKDIILKSGEKANVWLKLDLQAEKVKDNHLVKSFNENYGFDLNQTLENSTIKSLDNQEIRERLIKSLEKGNQTEVTFLRNGLETTGFVSANPQYKSLDFADANLKAIFSKEVTAKANEALQKQDDSIKDLKQGDPVEVPPTQKKGRGR